VGVKLPFTGKADGTKTNLFRGIRH